MNDVLKEMTSEILNELNPFGQGAYRNFTGMYGGSVVVNPRDDD
jgi:hypothetical protein